jgi:hypothetical protein
MHLHAATVSTTLNHLLDAYRRPAGTFALFESVMLKYEGRTHWAKQHTCDGRCAAIRSPPHAAHACAYVACVLVNAISTIIQRSAATASTRTRDGTPQYSFSTLDYSTVPHSILQHPTGLRSYCEHAYPRWHTVPPQYLTVPLQHPTVLSATSSTRTRGGTTSSPCARGSTRTASSSTSTSAGCSASRDPPIRAKARFALRLPWATASAGPGQEPLRS